MLDWIGKLADPIKELFSFIRKHYLAVAFFFAFVSWALLLIPSNILDLLNINTLRTTYLVSIGLTALLTFLFIIFILLFRIYAILSQKWSMRQESKERRALMDGLTPIELRHLSKYIDNESQTATFTVYDGVVSGLINKNILYKTDTKTNSSGEQDFNIYPWAYNYLKTASTIVPKRANTK